VLDQAQFNMIKAIPNIKKVVEDNVTPSLQAMQLLRAKVSRTPLSYGVSQ
jgi:hypothetical protein